MLLLSALAPSVYQTVVCNCRFGPFPAVKPHVRNAARGVIVLIRLFISFESFIIHSKYIINI